LKIDDSIIDKQLVEIDSLKQFYQKLKWIEANKEDKISETSINLSGENRQLDQLEIVFLTKAKQLNDEILSNNQKKADTKNIVNIISSFPVRGVLVNDFFRKFKVLFPLATIGLTFMVLVAFELNRYLKNYS